MVNVTTLEEVGLDCLFEALGSAGFLKEVWKILALVLRLLVTISSIGDNSWHDWILLFVEEFIDGIAALYAIHDRHVDIHKY